MRKTMTEMPLRTETGASLVRLNIDSIGMRNPIYLARIVDRLRRWSHVSIINAASVACDVISRYRRMGLSLGRHFTCRHTSYLTALASNHISLLQQDEPKSLHFISYRRRRGVGSLNEREAFEVAGNYLQHNDMMMVASNNPWQCASKRRYRLHA